ncbi:MAG: GNAT family N-acetyltransferase [Candidatus Zipacnadales bacterium]
MSVIIRTVRSDELEEFERFLERCYGSGWGSFARWQPQFFSGDAQACQWHLLLEIDGHIVSHVGGYPLEIVIGPSRVRASGMGNVATHPDKRGRGYMTRLITESLKLWRERGWTLSVLWGDRQRYAPFGYEVCGLKYTVSVNRRSLERGKVKPVEIAECNAAAPEVVDCLAALHATLPYRVERPDFALKLRREGIRVFLGPDGYLLSRGDYGDMPISEIVSPTHQEPGMIAGAFGRTFAGAAHIEFGPADRNRLLRLVKVMSGWSLRPQGMFRILNWPGLLSDLKDVLAEHAAEVPPFGISIGCRWQEKTEWATLEWDGSSLNVEPRRGANAIEIYLPVLTGILLGSPHPIPKEVGSFARLLPIPLHIPALDHV